MEIRDLKSKFIQSRDYQTDDVNALMDFAKKAYVHNEIDIKDYCLLVRELEKLGAEMPDTHQGNPLLEGSK